MPLTHLFEASTCFSSPGQLAIGAEFFFSKGGGRVSSLQVLHFLTSGGDLPHAVMFILGDKGWSLTGAINPVLDRRRCFSNPWITQPIPQLH